MFIDSKKAYNVIARHGVWQMFAVYGVEGNLLTTVKSFNEDSRACVKVGLDASE